MLDEVALFVEIGVVGALELAISLRRDDGFGSRFSDPVAQVVGIITLVGDRGADLEAVDKFMCEGNVVTLAGAGDQTDRIAERIAGGMDLGAQPPAGTRGHDVCSNRPSNFSGMKRVLEA